MSIDLVAREDELAVVDAFLDRPATGVRALVIEGEPGIGKSTLWLAGVAAAHARSFQVLTSRPAETERTLPNVVLGDLFGDVPPEVLATLPAPRRRAFESALLLQDLPDAPIDPRALGVAILTLLPILGSGGPLLLAIDDDQSMDPSSAATLLFALRRLRDQPISLLLSRRSAAPSAAVLEGAVDPTSVVRLAVGPLSMGGVQALLLRRLGMSVPRIALARLHEASGGNPFYALELAGAQSSDSARDANLPLAVPPSLELLVGARLRALDPEARRALLLISAHGRTTTTLLRALEVPPDALERADAAKVIETQDGVVRFTHPLLASTLYQGAPGDERRDAHRRLALVVDDPVQRGRHLALAANEAGHELAAALESAANTARDRGMPVAAAELAGHATRLTPADAVGDLHRRAILTARAHSAAGEGNRARSIATDLTVHAPAGRLRVEALVLRAELEPPALAIELLDEALVEAVDVPELQAAIHCGLAEAGFLSSTRGRIWSERHARAALLLAERLDDDALRADALAILASTGFGGRDAQALELAERAYRLATSLGDLKRAARAIWSLALVLTWLGNVDRAREWLEARLQEWSDRNERVRQDILWYLSVVETSAGRWDLASEYSNQVLEIVSRYGIEAPYDRFPSALVALHRGEVEVAKEQSRRALALGEGLQLELYFGILAMCDLWSADPKAAVDNFILADRAADAIGEDDPSMRFWHAEHVEALLQLNRVDDAEHLTLDWEAAGQRLGRERVLAQAVRCRGLIAAARGDLPTALDLLDEAVRAHDAAGDPFGRARALLAVGTVRRRTRQKRTARTAIEAALTGFEELGAASWAATARRELARIGGRTRIKGLSPSEMSVAALVAEGRTNHEIATALFLGERTIASHLTHIYAKLGIRSRTELARRLARDANSSAGDATKDQTS